MIVMKGLRMMVTMGMIRMMIRNCARNGAAGSEWRGKGALFVPARVTKLAPSSNSGVIAILLAGDLYIKRLHQRIHCSAVQFYSFAKCDRKERERMRFEIGVHNVLSPKSKQGQLDVSDDVC